MEEIRQRVGDRAYVVGYGHLGDGNLHLNLAADSYVVVFSTLI